MKFITISKNGTINNVVMRSDDPNNIYKKCGFKNNNNFSSYHVWEIKLNEVKHLVTLYGKDSGRALNENKYELPPPVDNTLFFGDIAILLYNTESNESVEFKDTMWNEIYTKLMGGFEDIENTDNEEEEETDYDSDELTNDGYLKDDFVVEDNELMYEEYEDE